MPFFSLHTQAKVRAYKLSKKEMFLDFSHSFHQTILCQEKESRLIHTVSGVGQFYSKMEGEVLGYTILKEIETLK